MIDLIYSSGFLHITMQTLVYEVTEFDPAKYYGNHMEKAIL